MICPNCGQTSWFTGHSAHHIETHGLDCGPYDEWDEHWLTCNRCGAKTDADELARTQPKDIVLSTGALNLWTVRRGDRYYDRLTPDEALWVIARLLMGTTTESVLWTQDEHEAFHASLGLPLKPLEAWQKQLGPVPAAKQPHEVPL